MKRLKMRPIAEDEGLSWQALCERLDAPPEPQQPVLFAAPEIQQQPLEAQPDDRAPPFVFLISPETHASFSV